MFFSISRIFAVFRGFISFKWPSAYEYLFQKKFYNLLEIII